MCIFFAITRKYIDLSGNFTPKIVFQHADQANSRHWTVTMEYFSGESCDAQAANNTESEECQFF